jgi:hypothetical protein
MADHNNTKYDWHQGYGIQQVQCMMGIRDRNIEVDLYIPFIWLHKGISDEDVLWWNKIGNETLFPAKLEKVKIDLRDNNNSRDPRLDQFKGLRITCKKNYNYKQSDARENRFGIINFLEGNLSSIKTRCSVYRTDKFDENKMFSNWNGYALDHQVYETGECLDAYIKRILKEQDGEPKAEEELNAYKITIDCSKALSDNHRLAILSFYRFLWSCHFDGLVVDTLRILKSDSTIEPWDALYYAMSKTNYSAYYGLLHQTGYVSMDDVKARLPKNEGVNLSFSNAKKSNFTLMGVSDFKVDIERFKDQTGKPFKVECITDKLKTLTKGKQYDAEFSMYDNSYLVTTDNYCKKHLLKTHFKVV